MNNFGKKNQQTQIQVQYQIQGLDDVFHNVLIALERLEIELNKGRRDELKSTAIGTERDLHDDVVNPPTFDSYHSEMKLQCLALFYQTNFDKTEKLFFDTVKFFLEDLLKWYGGRSSDVAPNEVEKYFIPIVMALDRGVNEAKKISTIIKEYVIDLGDSLAKATDEEKEKAVREGFEAYLKGLNKVAERREAMAEKLRNDKTELELTSHQRGTALDGYNRLINFFKVAYEDNQATNLVERVTRRYLPELLEKDATEIIPDKNDQEFFGF